MSKIIKNYLLVAGSFADQKEEKVYLRANERDAIKCAEEITDWQFEYCYIYLLDDKFPNGRREINYICHIH